MALCLKSGFYGQKSVRGSVRAKMPFLNFDISKINITFASSLRENETLWNTAFCTCFSRVQIVDNKKSWKVKMLTIRRLAWLIHFRQRPLENQGLTVKRKSFLIYRDTQFAHKLKNKTGMNIFIQSIQIVRFHKFFLPFKYHFSIEFCDITKILINS